MPASIYAVPKEHYPGTNTHYSKPTLYMQACTSHLPRSASWPVQPTTSTSTAGPTHQPQPKTSCTWSNPSTATRPTARPRRRPHHRPGHLPHRDLYSQENRHHAADGAGPDARAQRGLQRLQHPILARQPDLDHQRRMGHWRYLAMKQALRQGTYATLNTARLRGGTAAVARAISLPICPSIAPAPMGVRRARPRIAVCGLGLDAVHNYMDYSADTCYTVFTALKYVGNVSGGEVGGWLA